MTLATMIPPVLRHHKSTSNPYKAEKAACQLTSQAFLLLALKEGKVSCLSTHSLPFASLSLTPPSLRSRDPQATELSPREPCPSFLLLCLQLRSLQVLSSRGGWVTSPCHFPEGLGTNKSQEDKWVQSGPQ